MVKYLQIFERKTPLMTFHQTLQRNQYLYTHQITLQYKMADCKMRSH